MHENSMPIIYFNPNTFQVYRNLQIMKNYYQQMTNIVSPFQQPSYQFQQWNIFFQIQNCSLMQKQDPMIHLRTTDDISSSQNVVETEPKDGPLKKRAKNTNKKDISSAKKNSQSNIINQFYSYLSCQQRSSKLIRRAIQSTIPNTKYQQNILLLFYWTIKAINLKRGRKYVNRSMMLNYFTPDMLAENLPQITKKLELIDFISLEELCQIFRRTCQGFLKIVSLSAVLTSKRITGVSKQQHFRKRRVILKSITGS